VPKGFTTYFEQEVIGKFHRTEGHLNLPEPKDLDRGFAIPNHIRSVVIISIAGLVPTAISLGAFLTRTKVYGYIPSEEPSVITSILPHPYHRCGVVTLFFMTNATAAWAAPLGLLGIPGVVFLVSSPMFMTLIILLILPLRWIPKLEKLALAYDMAVFFVMQLLLICAVALEQRKAFMQRSMAHKLLVRAAAQQTQNSGSGSGALEGSTEGSSTSLGNQAALSTDRSTGTDCPINPVTIDGISY
jgi:hypothetical protein